MVPAVVGAVVGAVLSAATQNVAEQVAKLVDRRCELWRGFPSDIDFIRREMLMIAGAEEDHHRSAGKGGDTTISAVKRVSMEEMRDLARDIEDCLDRVLRHAAQGSSSPLLWAGAAGGGGPALATEVKRLKERLRAAHQRKADYNVDGGCQQLAAATTITTRVVGPVGIDEPKRELLELLLRGVEGRRPEQLTVISIVGFSGSGKTTLAAALFGCPDVVRQFPCRAWVVASEHSSSSKGFLAALLEKLRPGDPASGGDVQQLQDAITKHLNTKRYLIVLDDIEEEQWDCIKSTLPERTDSRIIVTTRIQALAEACCNHGSNGYVYSMRSLDEKHSKELLQAVLRRDLPGYEQSSTLIVNKCDGHPLALFSVANYLQKKSKFTETDCKNFWSDLGSHMAKEYAFRNLQQVLLNNYRSLPGHPVDLKTCLLYVCVFPNGHPIRRSTLMRRWLAEGYIKDADPGKALLVADRSLDELVDRNIMKPIDPSKNAKLKTCRAHGIMHEFMLHMSMSAKFITSLGDPQRSNYRHLFMDGRPATSSGRVSNVNHRHTSTTHGGRGKPDDEKLRAHSLTICGSAGEAVVDFANCCELLRVLDLEECKDLKDDHLDGIHNLWHLKYLSLGAAVSRLPRKIEKLHCLETLDMRNAMVEIILPVEVLKLPYLAHILGKFKLGKRDWKMSESCKFLLKESNLQTLAGFVIDNNPGFPMLMVRMKKLRNVKIWCHEDDSNSLALAELSTGIKKFVEDELDACIDARCLSLHLGNSSVNILHSLENSFGYLSSLKLHGALNGLTQFATSLCGLTELCLSSTNSLMSTEILNLRKLIHLEYLKLVRVSLAGFIIRRQDFPRLLRLCLVQSPTLPTTEEGALRNLVSLQLLSEDLGDVSGIEIGRHEHLQEVALDSKINKEAKRVWEDAAKKHPRRPRVLYLKRVDPQGMGSMVKYVAAREPEHETECSVMQEMMNDQELPAAQENRVEVCPNSKNSNVCGLKHGKRLQSAGVHGKIKEPNHQIGDKDDGEDKNFHQRHKRFSGYQKAGVVIKETALDISKNTVTNTAIRAVDNCRRMGKRKVDEIPENAYEWQERELALKLGPLANTIASPPSSVPGAQE